MGAMSRLSFNLPQLVCRVPVSENKRRAGCRQPRLVAARLRGILLADACLLRMSQLFTDYTVITLDEIFCVYRCNGRQVIPIQMPQEIR